VEIYIYHYSKIKEEMSEKWNVSIFTQLYTCK